MPEVRVTVKVHFLNGPLRLKTLDVLERTARRGMLLIVNPVYVKGEKTTRYQLRWTKKRGWVGVTKSEVAGHRAP